MLLATFFQRICTIIVIAELLVGCTHEPWQLPWPGPPAVQVACDVEALEPVDEAWLKREVAYAELQAAVRHADAADVEKLAILLACFENGDQVWHWQGTVARSTWHVTEGFDCESGTEAYGYAIVRDGKILGGVTTGAFEWSCS